MIKYTQINKNIFKERIQFFDLTFHKNMGIPKEISGRL